MRRRRELSAEEEMILATGVPLSADPERRSDEIDALARQSTTQETTVMTYRLTRDHQPTQIADGFVIDASSLGLRPGKWPGWIATDLGNGQPLNLTRFHRDDVDEVLYAVYCQLGSPVVVHVIND